MWTLTEAACSTSTVTWQDVAILGIMVAGVVAFFWVITRN